MKMVVGGKDAFWFYEPDWGARSPLQLPMHSTRDARAMRPGRRVRAALRIEADVISKMRQRNRPILYFWRAGHAMLAIMVIASSCPTS